jgi:EAL domain-containing protein (putative c-di-GMP-specific phosphodiesterase class I)
VEFAFDGFRGGRLPRWERQEWAADYLKLAASLVRESLRNKDRQRQLASTVRSGRDLGSRIVALGIQSQSEAEMCRRLGCHYAQGPRFASPRQGEPTEGERPPARTITD